MNVSYNFRFEPKTILTGEPDILRITLAQFRPAARGLPIRGRSNYQSDQVLATPAAAGLRVERGAWKVAGRPEGHGQPVEQLRVRGRSAAGAEIVGSIDQPATEQMLPEVIDRHAAGQRIGWIDQSARQIK